jgi:hypothetical protein
METLKETTVPLPKELPQRTAHPALRLFADHGWAARMWFLVAIGAVLLVIIQPFFIIAACRTQERVVIMDETGTFHVSPLLDFEDATKLHTSQALLAALALLQKNPNGFDYPDILEKMFLAEALDEARQQNAAESGELKAKHVHQKVEIFHIDILETRNDRVLVEMSGQLIRLGLFNGQSFTEAPKFTLRLTLARNPDLARNGRYPMAVWKFDLIPSSSST